MAVTAVADPPHRQIPAFPSLPDHRQPELVHLDIVEATKGIDEILKPLVRSNQAEEQDVESVAWSLSHCPSPGRIMSPIRCVMVEWAMRNDDTRSLSDPVSLLNQGAISLGMDHECRGEAKERATKDAHPNSGQRDTLLGAIQHLMELDDDRRSA